MLLNIGLRPDGSISEIQLDRLNKLGEWLAVNGEGIFGSQPSVRASASDDSSSTVRFTRKENAVYAYILDPPRTGAFTIPEVIAAENSKLRILGSGADSEWKQNGRAI